MNTVFLGIFAYILIQLLIGVFVSRRIASEDDYLLAGRSLGLRLGTFTVFATWFGAETCIGAAGSIYRSGLAGGSSDPFGYAACLFFMGLFFAAGLWRRRLTTMADFFRQRYSPGVERLAALILAPTSVLWAAAQIRAFGQILAASSDFPVAVAITVAAAVVIAYTVFGGLLADVITDLVQGIVLIVGLTVLFYVVMDANGGFFQTMAKVNPEKLRLFGGNGKSLAQSVEAWAVPIAGSLFSQELVSRVLASRCTATARTICLSGGLLYLFIGLMPVFVGLAGAYMLPNLENPEQILPRLAQSHLGTFVYIVFIGALISAILSTVDSALLAASALVSHNLILPMVGTLTEAGKVRVARSGVFVFGIAAYGLALTSDGVSSLVEEASAFGGASIFTVAIFGMLTTRFGRARSALAALFGGMLSRIGAEYGLHLTTPFLASLGIAAGTYVLVALFESRQATQALEGASP